MQIRKIYSIVIILFIAGVSARAESLQELINRKKIEAIAKVKPIVQKMINDSIELYKQHPLWHDDYKDAENFHYIYSADLDYNDKAFYFDDSTSVNSVIDTTQFLSEGVRVIDKQDHGIVYLDDNGGGFINGLCIYEEPTINSGYDFSHLYKEQQNVKKQFDEEGTFVTLPFHHLATMIIIRNRLYIRKWFETKYHDYDEFIKNKKDTLLADLEKIRYGGIYNRVKAISRTKNFKPEIKRDFSKSIRRIENTLDSLDNIYLKPIINDKRNKFFREMLKDEYNTLSLCNIFTELGLTFDEFIRDSAKLSFKSKYRFKTKGSLLEFQVGDNILDSLKYNPRKNSEIDYCIYWDDMRIGEVDDGELNCYMVCDESECDNSLNKHSNDYNWLLETEFGTVINIKNELYFMFSYYYTSSPIPYQQFLEQVIDEYYLRKDYGR